MSKISIGHFFANYDKYVTEKAPCAESDNILGELIAKSTFKYSSYILSDFARFFERFFNILQAFRAEL